MTQVGSDVWRKYEIANIPASGPHQPDKAEIIAWATLIESLLNSTATNLSYATRPALLANLVPGDGTLAIVYADTTPANNGLYRKSGATTTGTWTRIGDSARGVVRLTVTGGTGNAITASIPETPLVPGDKLYLLTPGANNTAGGVTINGTPVKDFLGNDPAANALILGSQVVLGYSVDHYQLLISSQVDASGILSSAQTAATSAAASATAAAASAALLGSAIVEQPVVRGRLTLTSGVAVTTTDVTGATSVFYTAGPHITCDGTHILADTSAEATLALDSNAAHTGYQQSGKNWFVFRFNDSGTIRIGTGPAWSSDTSVGTGAGTSEVHLFGNTGEFTNANSIVLRWGSASGNTTTVAADHAVLIGGFRTTADGVTEDSAVKRFLSNLHNPISRKLVRNESTASWTYSTATYRQANANAANQVEYFSCFGATSLDLTVKSIPLNSTSTLRIVYTGIGVDSTTVATRTLGSFQRVGDGTLVTPPCESSLNDASQQGYHKLCWLEKGAGSDTQTWFGPGTDYQSGLSGRISN